MNNCERYARTLIRIYNAFPPVNGVFTRRKRDRAISLIRRRILDQAKKTNITEFRIQVNRHVYNVTIQDEKLLNISLLWVIPFTG
ncbi:hypothetical protein [Candidatus Desulfofervidus auxilii]|uniref:hypothetical protein n=1 Tax=Desulfofervidus auxilii TaxID=1621989 RepID=UPI00082474FA|nr:hypothetical protein [Candidatus Desulfofervidus auxilii]